MKTRRKFMKLSRVNGPELTPAELRELDKLRAVIEGASADGIITKGERDRIASTMRADGRVTREELELVRTLVTEKVNAGQLTLDYL
jgi:uncharacterized membrane protein YebE (DUF533 family)